MIIHTTSLITRNTQTHTHTLINNIRVPRKKDVRDPERDYNLARHMADLHQGQNQSAEASQENIQKH